MLHRDRYLRGTLTVLQTLLLALIAAWGGHAILWAQPLLLVTPALPQLSLDRGQSATDLYTVTNNSAIERTLSVSFSNVPSGLSVVVPQGTVVVSPAEASIEVPVLVAATTSAPIGRFVIFVEFRGLAPDGSVFFTMSALSVTVKAPYALYMPYAAQLLVIPSPTLTPYRNPYLPPPAPLPDRSYLPFAAQPWLSAYPAPTAGGTPILQPTPTSAWWGTPIIAPTAWVMPTRIPGHSPTPSVTAVRLPSPPPTAWATLTRTPGPPPTAWATLTRTPGPAPTTPTLAPLPVAVAISGIFLRDPRFPDDAVELAEIENIGPSPVDLTGWRLLNASRAGAIPAYTFPTYTLYPGTVIIVFSTVGDNDPATGDFFWNQPSDIWRAGDRAELRDSHNNLISTLAVPSQ